MRYLTILLAAALPGMIAAGCRQAPPPPRVPVPTAENPDVIRERDRMRPVHPAAHDRSHMRYYDDVPLVVERPPEQHHYVHAYNQVGRPRIIVFVNRTLEGNLIPVQPHEPVVAYEHTRRTTAGTTIEDRETYTRQDRWRDERRERVDRFQTDGPGEYRETFEVYLRPGEYDEIHARSIDYQAVENILTDWLAANGQVEIVAPVMARGRLTDEQIQDLQSGRPKMLSEIARELDSDVLVQVQARPTRQTPQGLELRVIAEAISLQGGQSIGRAVVDVIPPLDKVQINRHTRFLARKLMDDMALTWMAAPPPQPAPQP